MMTPAWDGSDLRGPLRIALVCPYSLNIPGGVQNHVLGLATHLRAHGHSPSILAPGDLDDADPSQAALRSGFTSAGNAIAVSYNGSVARVNFGPLAAVRVRRWLRAGNFDLVHIHEPITPSVAVLALWAAKVPVVATFHTATPRSRTMQLAGRTLRTSVRKIDAGIAVSEYARRVVVQHLGRDAVVIPNGLDFAEFAAGPLSGISRGDLAGPAGRLGPKAPAGPWRGGGRPRLFFLGRFDEPRKGLDVLLAALPRVRAVLGPLEVVIAGHGNRRLPADCRVLGTVSNRERSTLLAATDVFVAPHLARESFGIVLLEAMAAGVPVVASDLPPFVDILRWSGSADGLDQPLGTVFRAGDPAALARSVCAVLQRPDRARVSRARSASERYDWEVVGGEVLEVYRAALTAVGASGRSRSKPASRQPVG